MTGMQEMMRAMMGNSVSEEEMADMQSMFLTLPMSNSAHCFSPAEMLEGMPAFGGRSAMPDLASMMKNLGGLGGLGGFGGGR